MKKLILTLVAVLALAGCVTTKKYDAMRAEAMRAQNDARLANSLAEGLQEQKDALQGRLDSLAAAKASLQNTLDSLAVAKAALDGDYSTLKGNYAKMLDDASAEAARMLRQLEANQAELEANKAQLAQNQKDLADRLARMKELENAIAARDAKLDSIKNKVSDALLGFEGKGLTVTRRGGKVYVSMEDKLLFKSGSYDIDPNGAKAVRDLATVLAANTEIDIMVEGHTDDVPYRQGSGQLRDNLDLSSMRANTVSRLILENKGISPGRIVSAGRGEWQPVDPANTAAARAKNRRTEIILSPKLDELLELTQ